MVVALADDAQQNMGQQPGELPNFGALGVSESGKLKYGVLGFMVFG